MSDIQDYDIIIIGGGAAGLTAAQYGGRANLKTLLIEEMAPGGQALVIDALENYPGFPNKISGFELSQRFTQQAEDFGSQIVATSVNSVEKKDDTFFITTPKGIFTSRAVIMATGAKHRKLGVEGEQKYSGRGVSYCATCDGPFFRNQKILVVGGGDAACDEALFLSKLTNEVVLIHRRDRFRAQKSLVSRVNHNNNIEVRLEHELIEIKGNGTKVDSVVLFDSKLQKTYEESFGAVFIFVGSIPQTDLVKDVEKDEAGYIITDQCMMTSIKGLFAAGDVRATPFRQIIVAAGEGAVASHCAAQYIDELKGQAYI